jgi:hypothetical protein
VRKDGSSRHQRDAEPASRGISGWQSSSLIGTRFRWASVCSRRHHQHHPIEGEGPELQRGTLGRTTHQTEVRLATLDLVHD